MQTNRRRILGQILHEQKNSFSYRSMNADCANVSRRPKDLARQLIEDNFGVNVILGGGYRNFLPRNAGGDRSDGRDLIKEWHKDMLGIGRRATVVRNTKELLNIDFSHTDYLLGK